MTVWVDELVSWARRGGGDAINTNPDDRQTDRPTDRPRHPPRFNVCVMLTQASTNRVCYYRSGWTQESKCSAFWGCDTVWFCT